VGRFNVEAIHPDDFLLALFNAAAGEVCRAARRQWEGLRNPPKNVEELLATLEGQGLTQVVVGCGSL
jgi:hypothetical protein